MATHFGSIKTSRNESLTNLQNANQSYSIEKVEKIQNIKVEDLNNRTPTVEINKNPNVFVQDLGNTNKTEAEELFFNTGR